MFCFVAPNDLIRHPPVLLLLIFCTVVSGDISSMARYLAKYYYLPGSSDLDTNQLRSSDEVDQAIRDLQFMGGLNETGRIDKQTVDLIRTPRCGLPDNVTLLRARKDVAALQQRHPLSAAARAAGRRLLKRYASTGSRWLKNAITWTITDYSPSLGTDVTRRIMKAAFDVWGAVIPLTFTEVAAEHSTNSVHADIRIKFANQNHGDGFPFDGKGGTLAHAFYPGQSDIDGDTHFDNNEKWVASFTEDGVHLPFVAVHEFGHALGLMHTSVTGSIMFPWYKKPRDSDTLTLGPDDIEGITSIYGVKPGISRTVPPTRQLPPPTSTTPTVRPVTLPRLPPAPTSSKPQKPSVSPDVPDATPWYCRTKFDAVTIIRQEIMLFKGKSMWRMKKDGALPTNLKATDITSLFSGLPPAHTWTNIDEVFVLSNNDIVFFVGRRYFLFDGAKLKNGFPSQGKPITDFGLPESVDKIDAMFRWGLNGMTYIVSGRDYWKYDEAEKKIFSGYPRDMSMWKGVRVPLDAAFQSFSGKTYFFSGLQYWEFDDNRMQVAFGYPRWSNTAWLGCPPPGLTDDTASHSSSCIIRPWCGKWLVLQSILLLLLSVVIK